MGGKVVLPEYVIIMVVIYCYLGRENCKVLRFFMNNFSYFEISASLV